jgi:glutamate synthase (ferredoxin)
MTQTRIPQSQGLYDPAFEHDACGIGLLAHVKGIRSHGLVRRALDILKRLDHRGGRGADTESGDGAGILTQIPHEVFAKWAESAGVALPKVYGVGMMFLPVDDEVRAACEAELERVAAEEKLTVIGWRTVPINPEVLGKSARATLPCIRQVFIGWPEGENLAGSEGADEDGFAFERKLYTLRKRAEKEIGKALHADGKMFYFASLSGRTIVYKGLVLPEQLPGFYADLQDEDYKSALALVHSRFSTNTFPSWERAHPYRYLIHNGEINTIKGNVNWMRAREAAFQSGLFPEMEKIRPIIDESGSDSAMLDNALEFLRLSGRDLAHAVMMLVPEPWVGDEMMDEDKRAFYEYHSCLMEPWDGPASVAFTDGVRIGACLDRNGLRPSRYYVTDDDMVIMASEVGVMDVAAERVVRKDRLRPGQMLLIDTAQGRVIPDEEIKRTIAAERPYKEWVRQHLVKLGELPPVPAEKMPGAPAPDELARLQRAFGYTFEELHKTIKHIAARAEDPVGSMGYDAALAVLSKKPQLLYNYFKQMFAQVTNPPIDAFLEKMITSVESMLGPDRNLLEPGPEHARKIRLSTPILTDGELARIRENRLDGLRAATLPMLFPAASGEAGLKEGLDALFAAADKAIAEGASLLVLSDRGVGPGMAPIPALLAVAGLHHHLIRSGTRTKASFIVESGEPREVHHFAVLLGYGAAAINPYLALASVARLHEEGQLESLSLEEAVDKYVKGVTKGLLKIISKMGISTIQSYIGAQIFEAIGIGREVTDKYFTGTPSRIGGIGLETIARETLMRHENAFPAGAAAADLLDPGDDLQWRPDGEDHLFTPLTIHTLQHAVRTGDYGLFREYSRHADETAKKSCTLRGLLDFVPARPPIPLEEVEPEESILRRFRTGAMSFGSISKEAHETIAIAMNRIGGKSNSGEGGEDPARYIPDENGDSRSSAIKQVASGRFGVNSHYLVNAKEIQIKMAQGAKPGEGGQLPGHKVYPWIAKARNSTPGVELISPPPHHDIYSIEDLAQLIYDLKCANPAADINVKLVSEAGVGTIAAGVAKARADVILISGYDGGTGAAARTSIKHAGMPWEIGLSETHQTLVLNGLRGRVRLEVDGKLMTGRDVVVAAMLGAEEFGFSTLPLVAVGCVMMRVCHLDTCPVGIATQNPELRAKFPGKPEHVINFMRFVAREVREILAQLGLRSLDEAVGRTDLLRQVKPEDHWKAADIDLSPLLYRPQAGPDIATRHCESQDHGIERTLDVKEIIPLCRPALEAKEPVVAVLPISNENRAVGTVLGSEVTKRYGAEGLPEDTIRLHFVGSAGQSFAAFVPKGITMTVEGDANDYFGKGLSGGKLAIWPPVRSKFVPEKNILIGNVALYGATAGEAYIRGVAGERFCVRNSGASVVVEGVGNHGCEYMTGGRVVILGEIGQNFAAGMSGGIAYIFGDLPEVKKRCNLSLVDLEELDDPAEMAVVRAMIEKHVKYTHSTLGQSILDDWKRQSRRFVRIIPRDYRRMLEAIDRFRKTGVSEQEAALAAFRAEKLGQKPASAHALRA